MRLTSAFAVLCACASGCETVVDVDLDTPAPQLVVQARFESGQPWHVIVQRTVSTNEQVEDYPVGIENAAVSIEGDDGSHVVLTHRGGGFYSAGEVGPAGGVTYQIRVEAEGFPVLMASDRIPDVVPIRQITIASGKGNSPRQIEIEVDDPAGVANYYELVILKNQDWSRVPFALQNLGLEDQVKSLSAFDLFEPATSPVLERAVIHDAPFDGRTFRFRLEPYSRNGTGELTMQLRTLSRAAFEYEWSRLRQAAAEHNPFVEPVPVRTNVHGGQGVFAGSATQTYGPVSPERILEETAGTYELTQYAFEGTDEAHDYVFGGSTGRLELRHDYSVRGELYLVPRPGDDEPRRIVLDGGFSVDGNFVRLHHSAGTALRDMALRFDPVTGALSGSISPNLNVHLRVEFGR